jgi:uncharacterized membrane protein YdbT with pleckstrin-like domain
MQFIPLHIPPPPNPNNLYCSPSTASSGVATQLSSELAVLVTVAVVVVVLITLLVAVRVTVVSAGPRVMKQEQALEISRGPLKPREMLMPPGKPTVSSS